MEQRSIPGEAMPNSRGFERGFTYIGLLVAVVILGLLLTMASRVWTTTVQREREAQLLWVGHAYRHAIESYYRHGGRYPDSLQQLLLDDRSPALLRHLRQLYPDPMTGEADWTLIPDVSGQRIIGVASRSQAPPIKRKGFELPDAALAETDSYAKWQFVYWPRRFGAPLSPDVVPSTPVDPSNPGANGPTQPGSGMLTPGT